MKRLVLFILLFVAALNIHAQTKATIADSLKLESAKKQLTIFFSFLKSANMDSIFYGRPITILAPDDKAFDKLPVEMLDSLLKQTDTIDFAKQIALKKILFAHIIPDRFSSKDVANLIHKNNGQRVFFSLGDVELTAKINTNRNIVFTDKGGNEYIVKQFDIVDGDAIIFVVSSVILPDKNKPIKIMGR